MRIRKILVPVDFSERSTYAFAHALDVARTYGGAEVTLLHTVSAPPAALVAVDAMLGRALPHIAESVLADARDHLDHLAASAAHSDLIVRRRVEAGDPAATVVRLAVEEPFDLIVIATHGRHGVARLVAGSVAATLISSAPCPVLVLKQPGNAFAAPLA
jgi:nucleotide-binding universal stress UspA family protein